MKIDAPKTRKHLRSFITVANIAEQEWFSRYPWPTLMTYDRGSEFIGKDFQSMIKNEHGIKENQQQLETHKRMQLLRVFIKSLGTSSKLWIPMPAALCVLVLVSAHPKLRSVV
jgi:hypothetical protein